MKINLILIYFFIIGFSNILFSQEKDYLLEFINKNANEFIGSAETVSIIQLIANPEKFDGKTIYIKGFLNLSFEGNALYLSDKDFDFKIFKNAIYLWLSNEDSFNLREQCNHKYVSIIGIFKVDKGHFGMFSGSIKNIKRIDIVEKRI
jgi:protein associated with RNAse G/E